MTDVSSIKPDEVLYVLTTDDARLKLIGEELANETGRAVLSNIYKRVETAAKLAERLNTTIPVIHYHLERLVQSGLIMVSQVNKTSRGRDMKRYAPTKLALLLIPAPVVQEREQTILRLKKLAFKAFLERILLTTLAFVSATGVSFAFLNSWLRQLELFSEIQGLAQFRTFCILAASVLVGTFAAVSVWLYGKWRDRSEPFFERK